MSDALFPRDYITELFLGGRWVDVSQMVHQPSKVTITRGAASEQGLAPPQSSRFTFYDPNDDLNPDNPLSPYYGELDEGTPVRQRIGLVLDQFGRTVSNSWGSTLVTGVPAGLPYSQIGAPSSDFSTTGTKGRHAIDGTALFHATYLPGLVVRNVRVDCPVFVNVTDVTGGGIEPANILLRGSGTDTYDMIRVTVPTGDWVELSVIAVVAGVETLLAGPVIVTGITSGSTTKDFIVSAEAEDRTIRCKAYLTGAEGFGWNLTVHDVANRIPNAGWVGVRSGIASGNTNTKPINFDYDNLRISKPRFQGTIHKLAATTDVSHKLKFVSAEAGGTLRTLGRPEGSKLLLSAGRRFLAAQSYVKAFWPLEESFTEIQDSPTSDVPIGPTTTSLTFARETGLTPNTGEIQWGADTTLPSIAQAPQLTNGGRLIAEFPFNLLGLFNFTVSWGMRVSADAGAQLIFDTTDAGQTWAATFFTDGVAEFYREGNLMFDWPYGTDNAWHHYELMWNLDGGDTEVFLTVDGVAVRSSTQVGVSLAPLFKCTFAAPNATTAPLSIAHLALISGLLNSTQQAQVSNAFFGWPGEAAFNRLFRLCGEESVPIVPTGNFLAGTEPMGPQRPGLTLLAHLRECEAVNMGLLHEPLAEGVKYRARDTAYGQDARVTLDYAADTVVPEFAPSRDDRFILNDVTAERIGGGKYRRRITTGPRSALTADQGGVGIYDLSPKVNVNTDDQLPDQADWRTALGTNPDQRFPKLPIELRAGGLTLAQQLAVLDVDVMDLIVLENLQGRKVFRDLEQLCRGYTEVWGTTAEHRIVFNTAPEGPFNVHKLDSVLGRLQSDPSNTLVNTLTASMSDDDLIVVTDGAPTNPAFSTADEPYDILYGGERMTVTTAAAPSGGTQILTVTRAVNGVLKAHDPGDQVLIADAIIIGM